MNAKPNTIQRNKSTDDYKQSEDQVEISAALGVIDSMLLQDSKQEDIISDPSSFVDSTSRGLNNSRYSIQRYSEIG